MLTEVQTPDIASALLQHLLQKQDMRSDRASVYGTLIHICVCDWRHKKNCPDFTETSTEQRVHTLSKKDIDNAHTY